MNLRAWLLVALFATVPLATATEAEPALGLGPGAAGALGAGKTVSLQLPEGAVHLVATPVDILAPDAPVWTLSDQGTTRRAAPEVSTFRAEVLEMPHATVRLNIRDGHVHGIVLTPTGQFILRAETDGAASLERVELLEHEAVGGEDGLRAPHPDGDAPPVSTPQLAPRLPLALSIAVEADYRYWLGNPDWKADLLEAFNLVAAVYEHDLDVLISIPWLGAWEDPDPYTPHHACHGSPGTSGPGKLEFVADRWSTEMGHVTRDTVHLASGLILGGYIGCAWIRSLGHATSAGVSLVKKFPLVQETAVHYENTNLISHELGHNFDGRHERSLGLYGLTGDNGDIPPYTIMNPIAVRSMMLFSEAHGTPWNNFGAMRAYAETRLSAA